MSNRQTKEIRKEITMKYLIKVLSFCGLMAIAAPAFAQISFDIHIGPPRPRREVVVEAPYPEAIWVAGYYRYDYDGGAYIWVPGSWQRPPHAGAYWIAPRYAHRGGRYGFVAGHWGDRDDHHGRGGDHGRNEGQGHGGGERR